MTDKPDTLTKEDVLDALAQLVAEKINNQPQPEPKKTNKPPPAPATEDDLVIVTRGWWQ